MPLRFLLFVVLLLSTLSTMKANAAQPNEIAAQPNEIAAQPNEIAAQPNEIAAKVDSIMRRMSLQERVAQLFVVHYVSKHPRKVKELQNRLIKRGLGGVILMDDKLVPSLERINAMNALAKIPLLVTLDGEWGAQMRYWTEIPAFPKQMQLGSIKERRMIYRAGYAIGEECKDLGFQVNYAPDVDVNNNPDNPVIHYRSFGEDPQKVALYGALFMQGMQDAGTSACAKHFPGHGDTDVDSHKSLPVLPFDIKRLEEVELFPFKYLIEKGVDLVMLGHLQVKAMDSTGTISSLSYPIITDWLKKRLGFEGVICTDALEMKGVAVESGLPQSRIPLEAFKAGVDILLMPNEVEASIKQIVHAVRRGEISKERLNESVRKILMLKAKRGLLGRSKEELRIDTTGINKRVIRPENLALIDSLANQSLIMAWNSHRNQLGKSTMINQRALPLKHWRYGKVAYLGYVGEGRIVQKLEGSVKSNVENFEHFYNTLKELNNGSQSPFQLDSILLRGTITAEMLSSALDSLQGYDCIIVGIHNALNSPAKNFGINDEHMRLLARRARSQNISVVWFGTPYVLNKVPFYKDFASFIIAHSNADFNNRAAARIVYGEVEPCGVMPVSAGDQKAYKEDYNL